MQAASISECGGRRHNEDAVFCRPGETAGCFAVADGLGGHGFGEVASRKAVELAEHDVLQNGVRTEPQTLLLALHENLQQMQQQRHMPHAMMTTAVIAQISGALLRYAYIGDSRLYLFRGGAVSFRTKDHSVPQMLAACGEIGEDEIRGHPDRNRLLQAAGMADNALKPGCGTLELAPGDALLLCSDGFWEPVDEAAMLQTLEKADTPLQWLEQMQAHLIAQDLPDGDNYSAIGVWIS